MLVTAEPTQAAQALAAGHLAGIPTETVYGLGANAAQPSAVSRVYQVKGRPADHPLIVHLADSSAMDAWAVDIPEYARGLAAAYWPGPLTLILRRSTKAKDFITGGQDTVALRVPGHPLARDVIRRFGELVKDPTAGIAAPSANRFGRVSPTSAQDVANDIGELLSERDCILDGGPSTVGVESTIVDCTGSQPVILRPGKISSSEIIATTGLELGDRTATRAPGTLASHYAPEAHVFVVSEGDLTNAVKEGSGLLALASIPTPQGMVRLSAPVHAQEYATVLYRALREADSLQLRAIYAVPPVGDGICEAINDRLTRAAHGE